MGVFVCAEWTHNVAIAEQQERLWPVASKAAAPDLKWDAGTGPVVSHMPTVITTREGKRLLVGPLRQITGFVSEK